jgi:hypothetical protein
MKLAWLAALALLTAAAPASAAQQSAPEEPIDLDRPDVTNGTHIVSSGLVQFELGGLYTHDGPGQRSVSSPMTARIGVLDWLEVRIGGDGLLMQSTADSHASGFGNVQLGAKLRLWADPGGIPVLSILPTVNLPAANAEKGLGSGDADYTIAVLTGTDVGARGHIDVNYGIGQIGAGQGRPHFTQHLLSTSGSFAASPHWNPYSEVFWFSKTDVDGTPEVSFDGGVIYTFGPRLALDGGIQVGLNGEAADIGVFAGISFVLGRGGDDGVHARQRKVKTPKTKSR